MTAGLDRRRHPPGLRFGEWQAADGWRLRRFDWPVAEARGRLLFVGGRGDFAEKYLEAMAHWRSRGWSVTGFDWRGQGGSGRLLADPTVNHLDAFEPLLDDLRAFVTETRPQVAVAHSMGGHLLLRLLAEGAAGIAAAVLSSPMLGLRAGPLGTRSIAALAQAAVLAGRAERHVWQGDPGNVGGRMTSCVERQADKMWWKTNTPAIASGGPSWGWTRAACRSIARIDAAALCRIDTPALLLVSERDPIVSTRAVVRTASTMPHAELALLPGRGHELLREGDAIRHRVLARIDAFLG